MPGEDRRWSWGGRACLVPFQLSGLFFRGGGRGSRLLWVKVEKSRLVSGMGGLVVWRGLKERRGGGGGRGGKEARGGVRSRLSGAGLGGRGEEWAGRRTGGEKAGARADVAHLGRFDSSGQGRVPVDRREGRGHLDLHRQVDVKVGSVAQLEWEMRGRGGKEEGEGEGKRRADD